MAKKNNPVSKARSRKPAPVKKPFPVGFAVGTVVLFALLGSIILYAAKNQGLGDTTSLTYAEHNVSGLVTKHGLSSKHVEGPIDYKDSATIPPIGGNHNTAPESCQVYDKAIANEHAVHSLEHGAVWITYNPSLSSKDVDKLKELVNGDPYRMLSPYPGLKSPVSLQAWGEQIFVDKVSDPRIKKFLDLFTGGPQAPERTAACQGTTATGPLAAAAPVATSTPTASASATPAPTTTPSPTPSK
jgi:hypothetical protein